MNRKTWNQNEIDIDTIFSYNVARDIVEQNEDLEPTSIKECSRREDWSKWKEAITAELDSLGKHEVFGPVVRTPNGVKPIGYKCVFVRKRNEKNEDIKQGLSHKVFLKDLELIMKKRILL